MKERIRDRKREKITGTDRGGEIRDRKSKKTN
jgi:hypothetical protein